MVQLVYASAATAPFSSDMLRELLDRARSRNRSFDVTGLLLYDNGSFLQVLEGPERGVEPIFASIQRDPRHRSHKVLTRLELQRREFGDWAMSFIDTAQQSHRPPGLVDYRRALPQITEDPTDAKRFLRFFQQGLCRQGG